MTLFVSYTRLDNALVQAIADDLARLGHQVWLDRQIHGGERWWQEIIQQIQDAEVFLFALSKDSWRSKPCRAELGYAEKLRIPIVPVMVGPLPNLRIPLAEKQIIDYRARSADAVIDLIAAVAELSAQPRQLPDPLPEPPTMPFEYLYRIASRIDVQQISLDDQGRLIAELRRWLNAEEDEAARNDLLTLINELRGRNELTVRHAAEIDEILSGIRTTRAPAAEAEMTRLPADHWRRNRSGTEVPPTTEPQTIEPQSQTPPSDKVGEDAGRKPPKRPASQEGGTPDWLAYLITREKGAQTGPSPTAAGTAPPASRQPDDTTPPRALDWWHGEQNAPESGTAPTAGRRPAPPTESRTPPAQSPAPPFAPWPKPPPPPSSNRSAFIGAILGAMGIPFLLWSTGGNPTSLIPVVSMLLLLLSILGLSMSVSAAVKHEPWSRTAVTLGMVGLLGAIVAVARTLS